MNNVLIIVPNDAIGGAEQYLKMVAKDFLTQGFCIYVFFFKKKEYKAWDDLESINTKLYYTNSYREKWGIVNSFKNIMTVRSIRFDYAFTSHVHASSFVGVLRKLKLIKINHFVARESTSIFRRFSGLKLFIYKRLYIIGYSSIDLLICQTDYMKDQLVDALPWLNRKIKIKTIPNPINLNNIRSQEDINLIITHPYIVSAGRLIHEKGFDILIKAFNLIKDKSFNLIILGEGNEREHLNDIINTLNLHDTVHLPGFTKNVYPLFKNAELCVVSSRIEGFPNVLLQMMSQNTKVVSTKCAGDIENLDGVFACKTNNIEDLYNKMIDCLNTDTEICRVKFDLELEKRSIVNFIKTIMKYLSE